MKKKIGKDLLDAKPSQQLFSSSDSSPLGIGIILHTVERNCVLIWIF